MPYWAELVFTSISADGPKGNRPLLLGRNQIARPDIEALARFLRTMRHTKYLKYNITVPQLSLTPLIHELSEALLMSILPQRAKNAGLM
jgi:hypothetical protein